ncbi:MAG: hypothetical protein A2X49_14550 [Lentisphaerae bacterium GWF2_52_8]|nr:MAG: hypothetical protein A2X49_14550 [Lentisphaerae bacterium GWF2_52_8]
MKIIYSGTQENAYKIAAETFAEYWEKITGSRPDVEAATDNRLPEGEIVLIGSDAANPLTHQLVKRRVIGRFGIRYGSDDYQLLSVVEDGRNILVVAGGCGRSTIYGVYDFFRLRGKLEYFWDGDIFHHRGPLDITNLNKTEKPHFKYRGLRYFAHRGAHRFFPEMWNLEEWQKEIDWALKKRFNLFMMRIGTDDLFQRAFGLPYPPEDKIDPDDPKLPHPRTALWPLKHRGEMREQVLSYARERGFVHPEDTGTMSHWYTPAPSSFFEKHPNLPMLGGEKTPWYAQKNVAVWDIETDRAVELYWRLTETHIREFGGGQPRMFHTIGLAERLYGNTEDENLQLKLYTLRRTQEQIRKHYPDTPLLIAGWDLAMWWKSHDVKALCDELDPSKTILFDYNADQGGRNTYREYETYKRFPWIFGMLHCLAFNNEMRGNYKMLGDRLKEASSDEKCLGFLLWPELSHSDTFILEFLAEKGWSPERLSEGELVDDFCARRYPHDLRKAWREIWWRSTRLLRLVQWGEGEWPVSGFDLEFHHRLLESEQFCDLTPERMAYYKARYEEVKQELSYMGGVLNAMAKLLPQTYENEQMRRDIIDITRAAANLALRTFFMAHCVRLDAWRSNRCGKSEIKISEDIIRKTFTLLADLLEQNDDFSLALSMERLKKSHPVHPETERLLKENASCSYCRNQTYEVVRHIYLPEMDCYFKKLNTKLEKDDKSPFLAFERDSDGKGTVAGFCELPVSKMKKEIGDHFLETPFSEMGFVRGPSQENLASILAGFKENLNAYLDIGGLP